MGKIGKSTGLKRKPAPSFWPISRKKYVWVVKPSPGPHSLESCLPLAVVLRDILGYTETEKEAKIIIAQGKVHINGKVRLEDGYPVGLMDVISLPDADKHFRVLPSRKGLTLNSISKEEAQTRLCRIENKTIVKKGHIQLNLHDRTNLIVKVNDPKNPQGDIYKTLDTVVISLPERQILRHIKMKEKNLALITGGKNVGKYGRILEIEKAEGKKRREALTTIEDDKGKRYQTTLNFVFTVGEEKPAISLMEAA